MTVADTDVLIDFLAGIGPAVPRITEELSRGVLCTTVVNRFELLTGARNSRQEKQWLEFLSAFTLLPLDEASADKAASIRRGLDRTGNSIPMADCLIAGIVWCNGGELLTRNRRHFERVPDLLLASL